MKHAYNVDIRWSDEDGVFLARVVELGIITHGKTVVEAAKHSEEAIEAHLESLKKHNDLVPEPVSLKNLKGKIALRISPETHQDVAILAFKEGLSINECIARIIELNKDQMLGADDPNRVMRSLRSALQPRPMKAKRFDKKTK